MKQIRLILAIVLLFCMVQSLVLSASASTLTYDDETEKFIFDAKNQEHPTDLFENFKNVMPGDKLDQEIVIRNPETSRVKIDLFLRAEGATEASKAFLSQLKLTVKQEDGSLLFEGSPDEKRGLADWVNLGTIYAGGEIKLKLTLEVPLTVGDEFQNARGEIIWKFKSNEYAIQTGEVYCEKCGELMEIIEIDGKLYHHCKHCDEDTEMLCPICGEHMRLEVRQGEDGKYYEYYVCEDEEHHTDPTPVTGDSGRPYVWMLLIAAALFVLVVVVMSKRKKRTV